MYFKSKAKEWLKETTNKVIISLITAGILTAIGLVYANKNIYAGMVRDILFRYWMETLIMLLGVILIKLYLKVRNLENVRIIDNTPNSHNEEINKTTSSMRGSINKLESTLSSMKIMIGSIKDDVLDLKREYLYRKAVKHEQSNQRGALLCRLEVVKLDIEDENEYNLEESLEELYSYVKRDKIFSTQDLSDTKNALSTIKNDGHKVIVDEILSQIKNKLG